MLENSTYYNSYYRELFPSNDEMNRTVKMYKEKLFPARNIIKKSHRLNIHQPFINNFLETQKEKLSDQLLKIQNSLSKGPVNLHTSSSKKLADTPSSPTRNNPCVIVNLII